MKQQVILIGLIFAMFTAFSQSNDSVPPVKPAEPPVKAPYCPHRIFVRTGMGYTNDIYNRFNKFETDKKMLQQKYAFTNMLEAGYAYYFHPKMGVGLGVGISRISARAILDIRGAFTEKNDVEYIPASEGDVPAAAKEYTKFYDCRKFVEKQGIWAIEVPLTFQFEHRMGKTKRNGIFASLGVKGYFPLSARTNFAGGTIDLSGHDDFLNVDWHTTLVPHFGQAEMGSNHAVAKLRPSVDLIADFGGLFGLTKMTDFYVGIYASYGFMDILPKEKVAYVDAIGDFHSVNCMLNSDALETYNTMYKQDVSTKWNLFQAGIKIGIQIKACGQRKQSKREDERDFLDKYEDRLNNAAEKARPKDKEEDDTKKDGKKAPEQVQLVSDPENTEGVGTGTSPAGTGTGTGTTPAEKEKMDKDILELIEALSSAQIYFDLDKDIPNNPRIAHREVDKAVTILKRNSKLKIILSAYTCKLGTQPHNEDLALRRANTIRNMFIAKGVDPAQIEMVSFTAANYPPEVEKTFATLEDARTVIFKIVQR